MAPKTNHPTTPQQRSDLARKAAQTRWSRQNSSPIVPDGGGREGVPRKKRSPGHTWIEQRFCLRLYQDTAGEWRMRTPAGLDIPASPAEVSLWLDLQATWLDLQALRFQLSSYDTLLTG